MQLQGESEWVMEMSETCLFISTLPHHKLLPLMHVKDNGELRELRELGPIKVASNPSNPPTRFMPELDIARDNKW